MKKILFILLMLITFNVKALDYVSTLTGSNVINAKTESYIPGRSNTSLFINISNLENIGYLELYVKYDKNLVGLSNCNLFNYAGSGCYITSNKEVYLHYKYSDGYEKYFKKYNFFTVIFMPKDETPVSGTTTVEVYFKDAKDRDGNPISISSSSKVYTFSKGGMYITPPKVEEEKTDEIKEEEKTESIQNKKEESNTEKTNDKIIKNKKNPEQLETSAEKTSDNNFIKSLKIKNYEIDFNKEQLKYELYINNNENNLDIDIELEDKNAKYEIIGSEDLKSNNYKVLINVVAQNNDKRVYEIDIKLKEVLDNDLDVQNQESQKNKLNINKNYIIIGGIIAFLLIITMIIAKIIVSRKDKKMFKSLDDL